MEFTADDVRKTIGDMFRICERIKAAGGISAQELCERNEKPPPGYWEYLGLDWWLPPNVSKESIDSEVTH